MKRRVTRYVNEVESGLRYDGYILIDKIRFDYEIELMIHFSRLNERTAKASVDELRQIFQIIIKKDSHVIGLMDDEYIFFFQMLMLTVVGLYAASTNEPETTDMKDGNDVDFVLEAEEMLISLNDEGGPSPDFH